MKRNYSSLLTAFSIVAILFGIYFTMMPHWVSADEGALTNFSTNRAMGHVKKISAEPHYVGSPGHEVVADYLVSELQKLGLETQIQEGTTLSDWGNLVKSKNIMARIDGSGGDGKALLLLSHYDSAPHSASYGAADDASGIAVLLEGLRAFIHNKSTHKNDIIILFSDAEELGLNGAALFVTQSAWAKDVGLVVNFEARGTAGPSYMLMEVNAGNADIVQGFANANTQFPVSNSLMYSIYKMLPNDTDLTVFREEGKIQGMNFAFIDDHFNYHTVQDDYQHLSEKSVAHQGSYLIPLLGYFSNADLSNLDSADDEIYFNALFWFFHYPFSWTFPLLIIAFVLFLFLVFIGMGKRILNPRDIGKGFILLFGALLISGAVTFFGWKAILALYPDYKDILHGFTYNGHSYISAFAFLTLAIVFLIFRSSRRETDIINHSVAPIFIWLLINLGIALFLPGAGFFILPVFFALLMFAFAVVTQRHSELINVLLAIPALVIFVPFIVMFPIGLGLKVLFGSSILIVLVYGLLFPLFGSFSRKAAWSLLFFVVSIGFFIHAHLNSDFESGKSRPNSLLYIYDADRDKAVWTTYDKKLDDWTQTYLTDKPGNASELEAITLPSKYNTKFTHTAKALVRDLAEPTIAFLRDTIIKTQRHLHIKITPSRTVNRYDIFANENMDFHNLKANGASALGQKGSLFPRKGRKILSYYVVDNLPLDLVFSIPSHTVLDMELLESSFDLMRHPAFDMKKRTNSMIPTPFVLNDAIAIRKRIRPVSKVIVPMAVQKNFTLSTQLISDTIPDADAPLLEEQDEL